MANGGDFTVPNGFPNDTFPMLLTQRERVTVETPSQARRNDKQLESIDTHIMALNANLMDRTRGDTIRGEVNVTGGDLNLIIEKEQRRDARNF